MRCALLLCAVVFLGCDSPKESESEAEPRPLLEVCEEFCPDYFACHDDDTPVEFCVENCVNDGQGEPECEAAMAKHYACRFENLCDGPDCSEAEIDAVCGGDGAGG